ncbi:TPA: hypothetical protein NBM92_005237 [Klebsiella oxytoca]|nr:hypothetical protein [Klebsiella oxytoca]
MNTVAISRNALINALSKYDYCETRHAVEFLSQLQSCIPDRASCIYIREKLDECLKNHDNGCGHFQEIRLIVVKINQYLLDDIDDYDC